MYMYNVALYCINEIFFDSDHSHDCVHGLIASLRVAHAAITESV